MNGQKNGSLVMAVVSASLGQDPSEIVTVERVVAGLDALPRSLKGKLAAVLAGRSQEELTIIWSKLDALWHQGHPSRRQKDISDFLAGLLVKS